MYLRLAECLYTFLTNVFLICTVHFYMHLYKCSYFPFVFKVFICKTYWDIKTDFQLLCCGSHVWPLPGNISFSFT